MDQSVNLQNGQQRRELVAREFRARFGRAPSLWVRAPGRVDAMGSHTDYNQGFVLTVPIDRDTWIAAAPRSDGHVRMQSLNVDGAGGFAADDIMARPLCGWMAYVQGTAAILAREGYGIGGCDLLVHGVLPIGSGLSSSASLEAATATLFAQLGGFSIPPVQMALLCQRAENEIVGVNCGVLDQYSVVLGEKDSLLLLDCRALSHSYAPLPEDIQPVVCNTKTHRQLSGSEYGERRADCAAGVHSLGRLVSGVQSLRDIDIETFSALEHQLPPRVARRCRFVLEENARVQQLAAALADGDAASLGALCAASFAGARDLYEITIPAMEAMYRAAGEAPGALGVRQAGAGFGGCMLAFVQRDSVDAFSRHCATRYRELTGTRAEIYPVQSADGAGPLENH